MADFTEHKEFNRISGMVTEALVGLAARLDCEGDLERLRPQVDRVADDMTKLLLRAWKINHQ